MTGAAATARASTRLFDEPFVGQKLTGLKRHSSPLEGRGTRN